MNYNRNLKRNFLSNPSKSKETLDETSVSIIGETLKRYSDEALEVFPLHMKDKSFMNFQENRGESLSGFTEELTRGIFLGSAGGLYEEPP